MLDGQRQQGGASRRAGGRDERPPQISAQGANTATNQRWIPPSSAKRDAPNPETRNDATFRRVRGILNKLAPEKFDKLSLELLNVGIESQIILKGIILLIFEKALDEPKYSNLYAQLCHRLCEDAPNFEPPTSNISTFRRLLLNKCQDEFENRSRAREAFDKDGPLTVDEEEQQALAKHKMLGNIKFIGELGKLQMLHEGILHKCIKQLLEKKRKVAVQDMSEDLECLCQIMCTVGPRLDTDKARAWMDQYFERMKAFRSNPDLPSRIRFMLQDVIELREGGWVPRKNKKENGPKTIQEVRQEAAKDFGIFVPQNQGHVMNMNMNMGMFDRMNGGMFGPPPGRGGLSDMFGPMPTGFMGGSGIGTGPGVITMDNFNTGYNNRGGRMHNPQYMQNQHKGYQNQGQYNRKEGGNAPRMQRNGSNEQNNYHRRQNNQDQNDKDYSKRNYNNDGGYQKQQRNFNNFQQNQQQTGSKQLPPRFLRKMQQQQDQQQENQPPMDGKIMEPPFETERSNTPPQQRNTPPPGAIMEDGEVSLRPTSSSEINLRPSVDSRPQEINLRPVKNYTPMFKPGGPGMLPKSAQLQPQMNTPQMARPGLDNDFSKPAPLLQKQPQIIVKPVPEKKIQKEAAKKEKKQGPNKEELNEATSKMLKLYLEEKDAKEAVDTVRNMKAPKKYLPELVTYIMVHTLDKTDDDREEVNRLIKALKEDGVITTDHFMEGFGKLLDQMNDLENDVPLVRSHVSKFAAKAVSNNIISLLDLSEPMENGAHYPLFLLCLQQLHKVKNEDWLVETFKESKIELQKMLPESDRNKDRMMEILEDRGLSFMFPLLRIQNDLWKQVQKDPSPQALYKWIKENVDSKMLINPGFVNVLTTSILKYVTNESTLESTVDLTAQPDKDLIEKEKSLLNKYKGILQKILHERIDLQLVAVYSLQVHCYNNKFPKGMLLRLFMVFYDEEIIDEETFLKWKEEVNDEYPGKGKALFQVNQWLTWLEQAEEESDEEDDHE